MVCIIASSLTPKLQKHQVILSIVSIRTKMLGRRDSLQNTMTFGLAKSSINITCGLPMNMVGEFWKVREAIETNKPDILLFPYPLKETIIVSSGSLRSDLDILEEDRDTLIEQLQLYPSSKHVQAFLMNNVRSFPDVYTKAKAGPKKFWTPSKPLFRQRKEKMECFSISLDATIALNEFLSSASILST